MTTNDTGRDRLPMRSNADHPDENALTRFAQGTASDLERLTVETHLDSCDNCRRAVAAAASEHTLPSAPAAQELAPGTRFGRYQVEREIGRGGMGIVYLARDVTLDRRVALKLLHARRDEIAQARLLREAQVMAKLAHPNVVPVFELNEWRGDIYLVMELVNGVTLETWLKAAKHSTAEILQHFIDAGRGLAAAHAAGVVHRDFKPTNVLVGLDGRVRVTDFGLSRPGPASLTANVVASPLVTQNGAILGTLAYMAPEQLAGLAADERSDQFAFCVSLAEALIGRRPFKSSVLGMERSGPPELGDVPIRLRPVLRRGLSNDPSRRFISMTALLNALESSDRMGRRAAIGLAAIAASLVGGFAAHTLIKPAPAPAQAAASAEQTAQQALIAADPGEQMVPIVVAARDLEEGTEVTFDMIEQRSFPARYVTTSVVKPEAASYIVNQLILVPVQKGDPLLWSQFNSETKEQRAARKAVAAKLPSATDDEKALENPVPVVVASVDIPQHAKITFEMLAQRTVDSSRVNKGVVRPDAASFVIGEETNVAIKAGEMLLWTEFNERDEKPTRAK